MGIVNSSYSSDVSETIEIAPIPPNLFTEMSEIPIAKNNLPTEINIRVDDAHNAAVLNGFVF